MGRNKQLNSILKSSLVKKGKKVRICCNRTRASFFFFLNQGIDGSHVCNQVKHSAAVSDLVQISEISVTHSVRDVSCPCVCHTRGEKKKKEKKEKRERKEREEREKRERREREKREKREKREIERDGERRARARSAGTRRQHKRVTLPLSLPFVLILSFLSSVFHLPRFIGSPPVESNDSRGVKHRARFIQECDKETLCP